MASAPNIADRMVLAARRRRHEDMTRRLRAYVRAVDRDPRMINLLTPREAAAVRAILTSAHRPAPPYTYYAGPIAESVEWDRRIKEVCRTGWERP